MIWAEWGALFRTCCFGLGCVLSSELMTVCGPVCIQKFSVIAETIFIPVICFLSHLFIRIFIDLFIHSNTQQPIFSIQYTCIQALTHTFMHLPHSLCIQSSFHFLFPIISHTTALTYFSSTSFIPCTPTLQFYSNHMSCQHTFPPTHPSTHRHPHLPGTHVMHNMFCQACEDVVVFAATCVFSK